MEWPPLGALWVAEKTRRGSETPNADSAALGWELLGRGRSTPETLSPEANQPFTLFESG